MNLILLYTNYMYVHIAAIIRDGFRRELAMRRSDDDG
jgi:hypothetical protein